MAIEIPWHSSSNWQPTEVSQFINHVNSGAGTLIVRTDAGLAYLKALGNPDGPHALVKDLLGTHLAAMLGLPTFDYAVIEVTDLDELPFFKVGKAEPGPVFVTRGGGELTTGVSSIANIRDEDVFGLFPEFRKRLSRDAVRHYASILGGVSRSQMEDAVGLVPQQWHLDSPVRLALASYLFQRASFVAETIESRLFDPPQLTIDLSDGGKL